MASSLLDQPLYIISDIKLSTSPTHFSKFLNYTFKIEITNNDTKLIKSAEGALRANQVIWNDQITLDVTAESTINFNILRKRKRGGMEPIGKYTSTVSDLLAMQNSTGVCQADLNKKNQLSFKIKDIRAQAILKERMQPIMEVCFEGGESWSTFLSYYKNVKTVVDGVTGLNPHAQQAWKILSAIPELIQGHITRNSNVRKLLQRLMDIYKYINEADRLPALTATQSDKLKALIEKTCECASFIEKYTKNNTAVNALKGPKFDDTIQQFKESFEDLFQVIRDSLILGTNIAVQDMKNFEHLRDIPYADNVGFVDGKKCLPGTRQTLIKGILEWIDKDTSERVLILSGQAGTGKSAVAHTVAQTLGSRLGSFFCFSRTNKERINLLFSTISRNLADRDVLWRRNLVRATEKTEIRKSLDPVTQFNEMIIEPANGIEPTRQVVIIIDALDESGDQNEREPLLSLLFERSTELPKNFRIIITSRPEPDITPFYQYSNVFCKHMADVDPDDTLNDIQKFVSVKLSAVARTLDEAEKDWCLLLAQKAQSLFQWAKIACGYILEFELETVQRLKTVLSKSTSSLYEMYHQILDDQPSCQFDSFLTLLKTIVGAIIVSRKPLSVSALQGCFGPISGDVKDVKVILKPLHSLLIGVNEFTIELRPIHTSLFDFFLSPEQKPGTQNRYYIDTSDQSSFTHACLRVMNTMLCFNICGLETSHLRNRDVPNFDSRVAAAIPLQLSYACCFWGYHLDKSPLNSDLLREIQDLMHDKLLYFFEALSLLGEVHHGRAGMQILIKKVKDEDGELAARATEASQFALEFGDMMMKSTPHLYLSSLPYISNDSFISRQFIHQYPGRLRIDVGRPLDLQPEIKNSVAHRHPSAWPSAVAFSPHGRQIATGFWNGDVWVWDYVTGEMICQLGPAETGVCDVAFSLNAELLYCCFWDGSILIWEAKTNKVVYESNKDIIKGECGGCTISSDGHYMAFKLHTGGGHWDICFCDRETRSELFTQDCWERCWPMFSPSGRLFCFQDKDRVMRLWDTQTHIFLSVCVSIWELGALSDKYIIANLSDRAWGVWDIRTGEMVRRFELDKNVYLRHFTFSTSGEYLLCSGGNKHWIWNVPTGEITQHSYNGPHIANAIAISPDSKHVAFSVEDYTMHVLEWDVLAQGETEDISQGSGNDFRLRQAWLRGQYLCYVKGAIDVKDQLRVFDMLSNADIQVSYGVENTVKVSPEENHWSIAYFVKSSRRTCLLCLWNINDKKEVVLDESDDVSYERVAFSATGDRLIIGDGGGNIKIWNVRTRQLISRGGVSDKVTALAFSSMGTTFFAAYRFDTGAFIEERECSESQRIVNGPFRQDLTAIWPIWVASNDMHIRVTHSRRYSCGFRILDHSMGESIGCFNVWGWCRKTSPDQRYMARIPLEDTKTVQLLNLEKGIMLDRLLFGGTVHSIGFSSDSGRIGIFGDAGEMNRLDIWDIETRSLLASHRLSPNYNGDYIFFWEDRLFCDIGLIGQVQNLRVHEIISRLYDDHWNNSQFGMSPRHPDDETRRLIEDFKLKSEQSGVLEYALVAWNKASFSPLTSLDEDGWMLGPRGELLFWVPEKMQEYLWYPCTTHMIPSAGIKLNFDNFVHGARWTECRKP